MVMPFKHGGQSMTLATVLVFSFYQYKLKKTSVLTLLWLADL